jgi:hypothetical protein
MKGVSHWRKQKNESDNVDPPRNSTPDPGHPVLFGDFVTVGIAFRVFLAPMIGSALFNRVNEAHPSAVLSSLAL